MCTKKRGLALLAASLVATVLLIGTHTRYGWLSLLLSRGDGLFLRDNWNSFLIAQKPPPHIGRVVQSLNHTSKRKGGIATVYPPSHYGKDLCLLFNHKHNRGKPIKTYKHPNVVHYVKIAGDGAKDTELQLLEYASILSVDMNYKPDKIVIHSNKKLTGELWKRANTLDTAIEERYVDRALTIGKQHKPAKAITHEADVRKIEIAMKEGGIVMDFDVIILDGDNLRRQQASSECVLSIERECTFINAGFISCVPNIPLLGKWWQGYQDDYRNTWPTYLYNCGEVPAKLLRDCPSCYDVYLDPEICMNPDAGAPGGPGPGRDPWKVKNGVQWQHKTVVHVLLHHLNVPKDNGLLNLWDCSYKELVMYILGDSYKQFLP